MQRRAFIFGLGATLAVVRTPGLLMPIRPILQVTTQQEYNAMMSAAVEKALEPFFDPAFYKGFGLTLGEILTLSPKRKLFPRTFRVTSVNSYPITFPSRSPSDA